MVTLRLPREDVEALRHELAAVDPRRAPTVRRIVEDLLRKGERPSRLLSPRELAQILQVSERTVRKWCERGLIFAIQPGGPRGAWRIPADQFPVDLEAIPRFLRLGREIVAKYGGPMDDYEA